MSAEAFQVADIDRFVALVHPNHLKQAIAQIAEIQDQLGLTVETRETWADPNSDQAREEFHTQVESKLGKTTLLGIWSGDGGANQAANFLCNPEVSDTAREAPIFLSDGKGACDTARSFNSSQLLQEPHKLLASAQLQTTTIHPLNVTFQAPTGERRRTVLSYFGIGTDAAGAVAMNEAKPELRKLTAQHPHLGPLVQRLRELGIVLPPACISPTFDISDLEQHPRLTEGAMEWLVGNGSRMARYGRFPTDLATTEVSIAAIQTSVSRLLRAPSVILNGLKLTRAVLPFEQYDMAQGSRSWEIQNIQRIHPDVPLFAQWDGETSQIIEGKISVVQALSLRALTTLAQDKRHQP